jgi:hypothetical protein
MSQFETDVLSRLDRLTALLLAVPSTSLPTEPPSVKVAAYDRPELTVDQVKFFDGSTFNADGSRWAIAESDFSPLPGKAVKKGDPYRQDYGYISPIKTPEIWRLGAKWNGNWANVDAAWRRRPYQIFRADIPHWLASNGEANNFLLLSYLMNSFTSFVQE